jgi:hypothetical protein
MGYPSISSNNSLCGLWKIQGEYPVLDPEAIHPRWSGDEQHFER